MAGLDQLLTRVFERKGFHVQGADAEALFARKGEEALLAAWKLDAPVTADDARMFLSALEQVRATTGILVATKGAETAARDALAANKGIEIWPESRLVIEVGEAFVKDAIDPRAPTPLPTTPAPAPAAAAPRAPTKFPSLVSQAASAASGAGHGIAYYMPTKKKEQPPDMQATIPQQRGGSLGYAWGGPGSGGSSSAGIATTLPSKPRIKTDQWGNVVRGAPASAAPARAAPAAPAAPAPASVSIDADADAYEILPSKKKEKAAPTMKAAAAPPACTTLKVQLSREEALAKAGKGTPKLALVPHVAFDYDLEMSRPGMPAPVMGQGAILVSSLTGELRALDALEFADAEPVDARKEAEKLTAVDIYDKVKAHIAKTFSRTMNVEREVAGNTVMETLKLTPDPDEMNLEHRGIVFVPVWEVTSATGVARIDAHTGNVLA